MEATSILKEQQFNGNPDPNARYELQQAEAGLDQVAKHLQRAARSARDIHKPIVAIALADAEYARDRVVRLLKHLSAPNGRR